MMLNFKNHAAMISALIFNIISTLLQKSLFLLKVFEIVLVLTCKVMHVSAQYLPIFVTSCYSQGAQFITVHKTTLDVVLFLYEIILCDINE